MPIDHIVVQFRPHYSEVMHKFDVPKKISMILPDTIQVLQPLCSEWGQKINNRQQLQQDIYFDQLKKIDKYYEELFIAYFQPLDYSIKIYRPGVLQISHTLHIDNGAHGWGAFDIIFEMRCSFAYEMPEYYKNVTDFRYISKTQFQHHQPIFEKSNGLVGLYH